MEITEKIIVDTNIQTAYAMGYSEVLNNVPQMGQIF